MSYLITNALIGAIQDDRLEQARRARLTHAAEGRSATSPESSWVRRVLDNTGLRKIATTQLAGAASPECQSATC